MSSSSGSSDGSSSGGSSSGDEAGDTDSTESSVPQQDILSYGTINLPLHTKYTY